ncbi:MAG: 50S ribosomal protein L10, partial [Proteobacteria bacterium]|nr:50S ribosomal protein L10 [Pseudomonadota bacterium]
MDRAQKRELVTALHEVFSNTGVIVVAHYSGLTVADMNEFRNRARDAGAKVKVAKNRLVKRALEGTEVSGITDLFTGPTCITYSDDLVAAPRAAVNFARENEKLVILGGTMGASALDTDGVKFLAS